MIRATRRRRAASEERQADKPVGPTSTPTPLWRAGGDLRPLWRLGGDLRKAGGDWKPFRRPFEDKMRKAASLEAVREDLRSIFRRWNLERFRGSSSAMGGEQEPL